MLQETKGYSTEIVKSELPEHNWEKYYQLKKGDIFVEAGAFWGRYALIAAAKECSKIILIEASPENVKTINNLIKQENLKNIIVVHKAITITPQKVKYITIGNPAGHRLSNSKNDYPDNTIEVDGDNLDNILTSLNINHVDLLGSDCEGAEIDLLNGASKYLNEKRIKHCAIGVYHTPYNPLFASTILKDKGYKGIKHEDGIVFGHV